MSKAALFVFFLFFLIIAVNQGFNAPVPPSNLTCTVTRTGERTTYTLDPPPTVTDHSSPSWANGTGHVIANRENVSELVVNFTEHSLTLKECVVNITYQNHGETLQEVSCHAVCSQVSGKPPSANHDSFPSKDDGAVTLGLGLGLGLGLPLLVGLLVGLVLGLLWGTGNELRCRRSPEGAPSYKFVKSSDGAGGSEVMRQQ